MVVREVDVCLPTERVGYFPIVSYRQLNTLVADDTGVLGVYGIGANIDRLATELPCIEISFEEI